MRGGGCSEGENGKALWDKGKGGGEGIPEGRQTEDAELQVDSALFTSQSSKKQNGPFFFFFSFFIHPDSQIYSQDSLSAFRERPCFCLRSQYFMIVAMLPLCFYESTSRGDVS